MRKKFGLLFQDRALFSAMTVYDNVAFPLRQHTDKSDEEIEAIIIRRLDEVWVGERCVEDAERGSRGDAQTR